MTLTLMKALTIITTMPQVRVEAADLIMVRVETDNLEGFYHKTEVKDLNIVGISFRISLSPQQNRTQYGSARKPYFQGNQMNTYRGRGQG